MTVTYSFEQSVMKVVNGEKTRTIHSIVDGDQGASYKYLKKEGNSFKKVNIKESEGKFQVKMKVNDGEEQSMEVDEKAFKEMIKKDKDLEFVVEYLKDRKRSGGKMKRAAKASSKKTSKKSSKVVVRRRRVVKE